MTIDEAKILLCQMYLPQFDEEEKQALTIAIQALEEIQQYRAIGTVEETQKKMEELERWHTDRINENIKNPFAYTSTLICHNCDHKDEYIEELESEVAEYKTIGTIEEFKDLKEQNTELHCEFQSINATMDLFEQEIRAKAIDEFAERIKTNSELGYIGYLDRVVDEIAEQMKGSEENG